MWVGSPLVLSLHAFQAVPVFAYVQLSFRHSDRTGTISERGKITTYDTRSFSLLLAHNLNFLVQQQICNNTQCLNVISHEIYLTSKLSNSFICEARK
jgi:hypothetical protein